MEPPVTDQAFDQFCRDADLKTPVRAASDLRRVGLPDDVVDQLVERYERHVTSVGYGDDQHYMASAGRVGWYAGPRPTDACWPTFCADLETRGFGGEAIRQVDQSTTRLVSLLEHPQTVNFKTKGLVLGHVQSGKTTNYTGVIAKTADRGYRLMIVLAGIHNELRRQTQNRLIAQLVHPNRTLWHQLTDPDTDFHPTANAPAYFAERSEQKVICVVKKNAAVLRKLIAWLEEASDQLASIPAIVIDDEADQAAVATTTINPLIRELLASLPRVAYIGYTATPFANLLIDPSAQDLYPRDFILSLPTPPGHFGTETIFGRDPIDGEDAGDYPDGALDMVRIVGDDEVPLVRPASQFDVEGFHPSVTGELRKAILYFWLATAARRARGTGIHHSTMLVHTSVRVAVHERFREPISALQAFALEGLEGGDVVLLAELETLWSAETARVNALEVGEHATPFSSLLPHLRDTVAASRVILDNSRSAERLDYAGEPVVAIAVGGNTLSRGLTLEGLVVSYFVRAATAYDTLLQMGRWFGYREGYADLPRIWMTAELHEWFRHLAGVEAEIRRDIARYMQDSVTPETFAVRIRAHPSLAITTAAKMQDAVTVAAAFGGMRVQTRYFKVDDAEWLRSNEDAAHELVAAMGGAADGEPRPEFSGILWREMSANLILKFLRGYRVHDNSPDNGAELIADYIQKRNGRQMLETWNVAIVGSSTAGLETYDFGSGVAVPKVIRARLRESKDAAADIKSLMSRRDAAVDLLVPADFTASEDALARLRREQYPDTALLTLYPIDKYSPTRRDLRAPLNAVRDVIGLGIVFPRPDPGDDDAVYKAADLSRVAGSRDDYLEGEDIGALEDIQL